MKNYNISSPYDVINNILNKEEFIEDVSQYSKYMYLVLEFMSYNPHMLNIASYITQYQYTPEQIYRILYNMPRIPTNRRRINHPRKAKNEQNDR